MKLSVVQPLVRNKEETLVIIDQLREAVESGEVVAFAAVGIGLDDSTYEYIGNYGQLSRLRFMGALASLQHKMMTELCE